jgi:hypothetical protein
VNSNRALPEALFLTTVELDPGLLDAISAKRAVLFTGAGASLGATRDGGRTIPTAQGLANNLSRQFLRSAYNNADFKTIYDPSCSTRSVREVQDFIQANYLATILPLFTF